MAAKARAMTDSMVRQKRSMKALIMGVSCLSS